jgi:hypothetical protein
MSIDREQSAKYAMSIFNVARVFAYPIAVIVLLAYLMVGYAVYLHVNQTYRESLMAIPAIGFIAVWPGAALLIFSLVYHRRLIKYEFYAMAIIGALGVLLLPGIFASALIVDW